MYNTEELLIVFILVVISKVGIGDLWFLFEVLTVRGDTSTHVFWPFHAQRLPEFIAGIALIVAFIALYSSRRIWYCFPHNSFLMYVNGQKSLGAKSRLYGRWPKVLMNSE